MTTAQAWPQDGLEILGRCPLCSDGRRKPLHEGLEDKTYFCAPGAWSLQSCEGCSCAYLDPRPTQATIARAYSGYYTHEDEPAAPASALGRLKLAAHRALHRELRDLPRADGNSLLLDVGCGNGRFLQLAREAGWRVRGIDFDAGAVNAARRRGLDASVGGIDALAGETSRYDAITLSHVVEHVYDPRELLSACLRLLKPGGYFWIETPNVESRGHAAFGRHWRGLEPPRHLILFHPRALRKLMQDVGFARVTAAPWRPTYPWMDMSSRAIRDGRRQDDLRDSPVQRARSALVEAANILGAARREFVTLTATKR